MLTVVERAGADNPPAIGPAASVHWSSPSYQDLFRSKNETFLCCKTISGTKISKPKSMHNHDQNPVLYEIADGILIMNNDEESIYSLRWCGFAF